MDKDPDAILSSRRILVVEDEYLIAMDIARSLERKGATILGPAGSLTDAMPLASRESDIACAVLDINLRNETVFPVADILVERGIPFIFATGYEASIVPERHADRLLLEKPLDTENLVRLVLNMVASYPH